MLDRVHAGPHGGQRVRPAYRVAGHRHSRLVRLVDHGGDLLRREERTAGRNAGGADPAADRDLDHVGPRAEHLSDLRARGVRAVALGLRHAGQRGRADALDRDRIGHAVGGRDDDAAHLEPWPGDDTALDRVAKARVEPAEVARRRAPALQRESKGADRLRRQLHEALVRVPEEPQRPRREVHVAVDQARHDGPALEVDHADVGPELALVAHGLDAGAVDHDRGVGPGRPASAVEEDAAEERGLHRLWPTIHDGSPALASDRSRGACDDRAHGADHRRGRRDRRADRRAPLAGGPCRAAGGPGPRPRGGDPGRRPRGRGPCAARRAGARRASPRP